MTFADVALLLVAGAVAAVIGTAGGITSLVSYPAMLLAGLMPFEANVANLVALVACLPGAALTSRQEIAEQRVWLRGGSVAVAGGALVGTVLLLTTPSSVFNGVVPVLVLAGSLALLAQPWFTARRGADGRNRALVLSLVALVSVYGGYFGAGSGVMLLALCLVFVDARLPVANAVKNVLVGVTTVASAVLLVCVGPVRWDAVAPLAVGAFLGSLVGPVLARRLPARAVRLAVVALGIALAVELWVDPA